MEPGAVAHLYYHGLKVAEEVLGFNQDFQNCESLVIKSLQETQYSLGLLSSSSARRLELEQLENYREQLRQAEEVLRSRNREDLYRVHERLRSVVQLAWGLVGPGQLYWSSIAMAQAATTIGLSQASGVVRTADREELAAQMRATKSRLLDALSESYFASEYALPWLRFATFVAKGQPLELIEELGDVSQLEFATTA